MRCLYCGAEVSEGDKFCMHCGSLQDAAEDAQFADVQQAELPSGSGKALWPLILGLGALALALALTIFSVLSAKGKNADGSTDQIAIQSGDAAEAPESTAEISSSDGDPLAAQGKSDPLDDSFSEVPPEYQETAKKKVEESYVAHEMSSDKDSDVSVSVNAKKNLGSDETADDVRFYSYNRTIAEVDEDGAVIGIQTGDTYIIVVNESTNDIKAVSVSVKDIFWECSNTFHPDGSGQNVEVHFDIKQEAGNCIVVKYQCSRGELFLGNPNKNTPPAVSLQYSKPNHAEKVQILDSEGKAYAEDDPEHTVCIISEKDTNEKDTNKFSIFVKDIDGLYGVTIENVCYGDKENETIYFQLIK